MTITQQPRHSAAGAQGLDVAGPGDEPHPSGPVPLTPGASAGVSDDATTVRIPRAALVTAGRYRPVAGVAAPQQFVPMAAAPVRAPLGPAGPPPAGMVPGMPQPVAPRNGLGIAGLVLGLCGLVVGLIPLFGFGAILLGLVGVILGAVGLTRARRGIATNVKTALTGVVACVLAVALGIAGLVIVGQAVSQLGSDLSSVGAAPTAPSAVAPSAAEPASSVGFGQPFTFSDGMVASVSAPTAYRASRYAAGDTNAHAFRTTVTLTNNTGAAFDPTLLQVAMSTSGAPASRIFDGELGLAPQTMLQPGRTMTYDVAFSTTTNRGEAQVDVTPSFDYQHAVFTGTL